MKKIISISLMILLVLTFMSIDLKASGVIDGYEVFGGIFYTRTNMTELVEDYQEYFEFIEENYENIEENLEFLYDGDIEGSEHVNYRFNSNVSSPTSPIGSPGFYIGIANKTEAGHSAMISYERFNINVSGNANYDLWIEVEEEALEDDPDYTEVEFSEDYEISINTDLTVNSAIGSYKFPLFTETETEIGHFLEYFTVNLGGGYYWGDGKYNLSVYNKTTMEGTDGDGDPIDEEEISDEEFSADLTLEGAVGFKVGAGFEVPVDNNLDVFGDFYYRRLEMEIAFDQDNDEEIFEGTEEDFSGLEFRTGISYTF
ncbi:hypothetical protein I0Q91_12295 [Halanaerobiaceae bacterium Z-7014]|uniref:Uncharacterized protein n=1 Tax=Halonatronomonas betaini TaxID=2778430 RepID=A0A931ATG5_9FIRM|nr:hypothetical protein [Halonatronomonas betaini]MBF8437869.1 hypothetical protein [Halonatronomonas betaini]